MGFGMGLSMGFGMGLTYEKFRFIQAQIPNRGTQENRVLNCKCNDRMDSVTETKKSSYNIFEPFV